MRRVDADHSDARAGQRAAGDREVVRVRARAADDLAVVEGGVHPLVRERAHPAVEELLVRRRPKYWPIA